MFYTVDAHTHHPQMIFLIRWLSSITVNIHAAILQGSWQYVYVYYKVPANNLMAIVIECGNFHRHGNVYRRVVNTHFV